MKGYATAYNIYDIPSHFVIYTTISYYVVLYHTITSHYIIKMSAHIRTHDIISNLLDFNIIKYMQNGASLVVQMEIQMHFSKLSFIKT